MKLNLRNGYPTVLVQLFQLNIKKPEAQERLKDLKPTRHVNYWKKQGEGRISNLVLQHRRFCSTQVLLSAGSKEWRRCSHHSELIISMAARSYRYLLNRRYGEFSELKGA